MGVHVEVPGASAGGGETELAATWIKDAGGGGIDLTRLRGGRGGPGEGHACS